VERALLSAAVGVDLGLASVLVLLLFLVLLLDCSWYGPNQEQPQSQKRRTGVSAPHECGRVGSCRHK
jgi:hypothetical protein